MYQDPLNQGRGPIPPEQNPDNQESLAGVWQDAMDAAQQYWSRLTAADIEAARQGRDRLITALHERYGFSRQQADQHIETFLARRPHKGFFARLAAMNGDLAINQYVSNPAPGPSARDDQPPSILPPDSPDEKT
ncbi:MAG: hypothetical protein K0Q68_752 [Moraxellaceae bacterium]|jgi:hypothetical protein|nr:hypothetical protein [Moraxellaceae bacterium]